MRSNERLSKQGAGCEAALNAYSAYRPQVSIWSYIKLFPSIDEGASVSRTSELQIVNTHALCSACDILNSLINYNSFAELTFKYITIKRRPLLAFNSLMLLINVPPLLFKAVPDVPRCHRIHGLPTLTEEQT